MKAQSVFRGLTWALLSVLLVFPVVEAGTAEAQTYSYDRNDTVIGLAKTYKVKADESLIEIARKFDLGYNEIVSANPGLDPFVPGTGASVKLPTSWVLPVVASYKGVVINLAELRLYYFFGRRGERYVTTFPVGIGSEGTDTPVGEFRIIEKIVHPAWHVPESIREEKPYLPPVVPPGPDNPLGSYAMRLSLNTILIHGTNRPFCVGRRASHGCIRLYPEDIPRLFAAVPNGASVTIVRQPVKVGVKGGRVFIEVHNDEFATAGPAEKKKGVFDDAVRLLAKEGLLARVNTEKLHGALEKRQGIPVDISD